MKKFNLILMAGMCAVLAVGCGSSSSGSTSTDSNASSSSSSEPLIVATEAGFAPYEYMKGNEVVGVDMDIAQAIADSMGRELQIQNMDFDAALVAVQQGKVDFAAAGISVDSEREKVMDFSDYYVDSSEVVIVTKDSPAVTEPTGEALNDMIVAVQQGNIADLWCSNTDNTTPKEVRRYTKFALAAEDLKAGKVDCIVMDSLPAQDLVEANDTLMILEGDPLFQDQYAIAVKKGNTEMLDAVNKVVGELKESGKIDEFIASHSDAE